MGGKTNSEIKTQISNELSMKIKNITTNITNITNTATFELTQDIKNKAEASVSTSNISTNKIKTGNIRIMKGGTINLTQSLKIDAVNKAIVKILSDASQLQSSSNDIAEKIKNKIDNDVKAKQDVEFLAKVGEYNKNNGGPEAMAEALAGVVQKFISSATGGSSSSVNETNIRNIVNTEIENQTTNTTNIKKGISSSIKSSMEQLGDGSCKTATIGNNDIDLLDIDVDEGGDLTIGQTIDISAFTTCIIDLQLGSKIASTLTNDFKVDTASDAQNVVGADQKNKSEIIKEVKLEKDSSIMKSVDNLVKEVGKVANNIVDEVGGFAGSFVYVIGGIIFLIILIMVGPALIGSGKSQETNSYSVTSRDDNNDDYDDINQKGGGVCINGNIYLFASFIAIFILISEKSLPLCGILLIVIILYFINKKNSKLLF